MNVDSTLDRLAAEGNLRVIPVGHDDSVVDLSSNDYLGLADDVDLRERFLADHDASRLLMTSSASRLLAARQNSYTAFERLLSDSYGGRPALLFNSGYHANTGLVSALADSQTLIVADKLVHASIIDGIKLSGARFERFRHNDYNHLERILASKGRDYANILIIAESVYSMDGDRADLRRLADLRRHTPGALLYVDEAHGVGAVGPGGLGLAVAEGVLDSVDILVGTLGKALASSGAFALLTGRLRDFMVNRARSLIFSTALPPACVDWSAMTWRASVEGDSLRDRLNSLAVRLAHIIPGGEPSHIRPLVAGDPNVAVRLSSDLLAEGYKVLPIRTPTVPPGTERLRFSLSASIDPSSLDRLENIINRLTCSIV
ncbi:MAG: 8-amino-7-oxononanoate synthase [Bacteroidales bacterium]|nr:8-amino-7-oxononanoate synthase [Bacteroidales bacterium]